MEKGGKGDKISVEIRSDNTNLIRMQLFTSIQ